MLFAVNADSCPARRLPPPQTFCARKFRAAILDALALAHALWRSPALAI
jgi:hypothetical protein